MIGPSGARGLRKGDFAANGTLTGLTPVRCGDEVAVQFGSLRPIDIRVTAPAT